MGNQLPKAPKRKGNNHDDFIIKYVQNNKSNESALSIDAIDMRRVVFVSLIGLYNTWKECPSFSLYTALFILPLKAKWIRNPSKYFEEIVSSCTEYQVNLFSKNMSETLEFIQLLRWKDSQGLVCWALDEHDDDINIPPNGDELVQPFWHYVNAKVVKLYDHMTGNNYNPLQLDTKWWRNKSKFITRFDTKPCHIMFELFFTPLKYKSVQEIIFQSNPDSLRVVTCYVNSVISDPQIPTTPSSESLSLFELNFNDIDDENSESLSDSDNWIFLDTYGMNIDD